MWISAVNGDQITEGKYQYRRKSWREGVYTLVTVQSFQGELEVRFQQNRIPVMLVNLPADAELKRDKVAF